MDDWLNEFKMNEIAEEVGEEIKTDFKERYDKIKKYIDFRFTIINIILSAILGLVVKLYIDKNK